MSEAAHSASRHKNRHKSDDKSRKRASHCLSCSSASSSDEYEKPRATKVPKPSRDSNTQPQQEQHNVRKSEGFERPGAGGSRHQRNSSAGGSTFYNEFDSTLDQSVSVNTTPAHGDTTQGNSSQLQHSEAEGLAPVVARHYNEIEEKGLEAREESKIVTLRKYNNWAKSMNFNDAMDEFRKDGKRYNTLYGLDLCCGKGGDLRKWEKSRMMRHVVFVDIADVSLTNCKERYEDMKRKHDEQRQKRGGRGLPLFSAEFIVADCTKEALQSKISDPKMMFDMVSCQFSFHYCFESLPQAKQMLRNVTENLISGGYFIGTLPNADRIVKRRRQSDQGEFGNEVYKVRFECEEPYPVYGARYFFELADAISCPEFLVHFPTFEKLADIFGLRFIYRQPFEEFHRIHESRHDAKSLLNGMGALESYPPHSGEQLHFDEQHYSHARRFIEEIQSKEPNRHKDDIKVGTISAVEWEAIRLYVAFCFRKK